jgi:hypothetical protein
MTHCEQRSRPPNHFPSGKEYVAITVSKKETSPEETPKDPKSEAPKEEVPPIEVPEDEVEAIKEEIEEEPVEKEKPKGKKESKKRAKLSVLQAAVLETIREQPQRPRAIQTIIRGTGGISIPRNDIIRSLNELRKKGLVDKVTTKAWQAK